MAQFEASKRKFRVNVGGRSAEAMARLLHSGRNGRGDLARPAVCCISLGAGYLTEEHQLGIRTFYSPIVIHFTSVFFLSAVALFPSPQAKFLGAIIGATALIGAIISTYTTIQVVRTDM